jgi:hypothetical protein
MSSCQLVKGRDMTATYEIKCYPPNEACRVVRLEARSIEEAMARAEALWCRQMQRPTLLAVIDKEPQRALAFL